MADKIECVDTIEKFFHLVNDEVEKHGYSIDEVLWIWASGQVAFEGDSKVTMRTLKEEVRRTASTNTQSTKSCDKCKRVDKSGCDTVSATKYDNCTGFVA